MNVLLSRTLINKINSLNSIPSLSIYFSTSTSQHGGHYFETLTLDNIVSSLNNCSDIHFLKKLHACIFTNGYQDNIFLGSKLLNSYAKFGYLTESRWVFSKIINNNLSLWNSVLVGYFRANQFDEVLRLYCELRGKRIGVHSSVITFGLKSCVELGELEHGCVIHVDAIKFGLGSDPFVGSSLIGLYCRYGDIEDASKVFDEIIEKDLVAYTSMISGYAKIGDHRAYEAFEIVKCMQMDGIDPNRVTLVSLLHAAAQLQDVEYGRSVHGYATRRGIGCFEEVFETCLMDMYLKCGKPYNAMILCSNMKFRSVASWNALIVGHLQLGQPEEALNLFVLMIQERQKPDLISLANGILCCADLGLLREGKSVQGYAIRSGIELDIVTITALIDLYLKCNNTYTALKLFNGIEDKDVISCNVMMTGFLQSGSANEVMKIFHEMVIRGIKPNQSTFLSIITACSNLGDIRQGKFIHGYVIRHNFESNTDIANQVIYMYAKCHFIDCARKVFNRLKRKDLVSWTSMMMGYVNDGHADEAMYLFCLMQGDGVLPDSVTLICLLQAFTQLKYFSLAKEVHSFMYRVCMENEIPVINSLLTTYSKSGKLHLSEKLFAHMKRRNLASWNSMIAAYGMHGRCHDALNLFKLMEKECIVPDELTITSVLSACSHSGLVEEGLSVFRSMKEDFSMIPCEEHYSCIVDLLSRSGQLEEAYHFLQSVPLQHCGSAYSSLLAACRVHGKTKLGEVIGRQFMEIESQNPSAYRMVSNLYAEDDRWDAAAQIRSAANERGFKRTAGYSMVELENQVFDNI
ncbi:hypothetical protein DCAR_0312556 [Daucus carota subsp. sativus]|uniref:Pentacotripeptide-repeat region of PRORP domain-containing protein n=1 Tax=Daucus carota subsp. sativus TaxID=79200 RepID=A0AAF0WNS9_DAUCS|nr:PREDICTED: pentatricopeptide repeat-containing protein At1g06140, mitochondrial [Daucus carota subsp. sativus]WOG93275.1 hypothetical protein DCAR_0312556 [Daucus carota subsp. sativus]